MAVTTVDWESVVRDVKAHIVTKDGNSFGQRELIDLITESEVRHTLEEGLPEKALRLYGPALQEALSKSQDPNTRDPEGSTEMGPSLASSSDSVTRSPEGGPTSCQRQRPSSPTRAMTTPAAVAV